PPGEARPRPPIAAGTSSGRPPRTARSTGTTSPARSRPPAAPAAAAPTATSSSPSNARDKAMRHHRRCALIERLFTGKAPRRESHAVFAQSVEQFADDARRARGIWVIEKRDQPVLRPHQQAFAVLRA